MAKEPTVAEAAETTPDLNVMTEADQKAFSDMEAGVAAETDEAPEPEAKATSEPETGEETPPEGNEKDGDGKQKVVPHQALHEERERRKAAEKATRLEQQQRQADMARLNQRLAQMQQMFEQGKTPPSPTGQPQDQYPDPEDPLTAINWTVAQLREMKEAQRQQQTKTAEEQRKQAEWNSVYDDARQDWGNFVREVPEGNDAYNFLQQSKAREFEAFGLAQHQIAAAIKQEESNLIAYARSRNIPVWKLVLQTAHARGWVPPAQRQQQQAPAAQQAAPAPQAQPNGQDANARIGKVANGQERNRSLSQAGGQAAPTEMTAESLLKMSDAEFTAWTKKHPAQTQKLMGA